MDQEQDFFQANTVDRTPYGALALVGLAGLLVFVGGTYTLWKTSHAIRVRVAAYSEKREASEGEKKEGPADLLFGGAKQKAQEAVESTKQQAQDQAKQVVDEQQDKLQQQAEDAIQTEAQKQAEATKQRLLGTSPAPTDE